MCILARIERQIVIEVDRINPAPLLKRCDLIQDILVAAPPIRMTLERMEAERTTVDAAARRVQRKYPHILPGDGDTLIHGPLVSLDIFLNIK